MIKIYIALLLALVVAGCSTIERRSYYSPNVDQNHQSGPEEPSCGWTNFGGMPDSYVHKVDGKEVSIKAQQNYHPYFWGPWFVSAVPVFPITWFIELFVSDSLTISIHGDQEILNTIKEDNVSIVYKSDNGEASDIPKNISFSDYSIKIEFLIEYSDVENFSFYVDRVGQEQLRIEVPFVKTSRWSWTQWTPNC